MIPEIIKSIDMQLIMPCFCAGANQTEPELRAASFRGELRWWFRCLGGTREQENAVFGHVHGGCQASAVALQVLKVKPMPENNWSYEKPGGRDAKVNSSYITYFLTAGQRSAAWLPPGKRFTLELRRLRSIEEDAMQLLNLAWDCMCNLGAVGTRKTRALGAFAPVNSEEQKVQALLENETVRKYFQIKPVDNKVYGPFSEGNTTTAILTACAQCLKEYRRNLGIHPTQPKGQRTNPGAFYGISALGNAIGGRQTSALRFRPVLMENKLKLYVLKAPDITLGAEARKHNIDNL